MFHAHIRVVFMIAQGECEPSHHGAIDPNEFAVFITVMDRPSPSPSDGYRMQANANGDLGKNACRTLGRLASKDAGEGASEALGRLCLADPSGLRAGTLLMSEWGGVLHHVTVVDEGFIWNGVTYPSLSKIAHAITGTRWNGPRFFGLRVKQAKTRLATIARDRTHTGNGP